MTCSTILRAESLIDKLPDSLEGTKATVSVLREAVAIRLAGAQFGCALAKATGGALATFGDS
jgi:hypothetical protein